MTALPDRAALVAVRPERAAQVLADGGMSAADYAISDRTRTRLAQAVPANTERAYARQWAQFTTWCERAGRQSLPATAQTLADYVTDLCDHGYAPDTIGQAQAAIRNMHRAAGHPGQPDTTAALVILRGYRRERAEDGLRGQRQAPPILIATLRAMIDACDLTTRAGIRNRLVLVLGLALMGRRSELLGLNRADVTRAAEGIEVTIRASKTDKAARGEVIAIPAGQHPLTNPVAAWADWCAVLDEDGQPGGRLLRRVLKGNPGRLGASLSGVAINGIVRDLAIAADVPNAEAYTAHSLRAGGATVAYAAGIPVSVIAQHGRWSLTSPVLLGYIRAVDRWKDNAMRGVGL